MTHYKMHLDDDDDDDFFLIAIHCSVEAYKMAFMLNKNLLMKFIRKRENVEILNQNSKASFSIFEFNDEFRYTHYYLVENKSKMESFQLAESFFGEEVTNKSTLSYLLPEFKKVDYFIKIESDVELYPIRKILAQINEIDEVISAYIIENKTIKSQNNLIFS